MTYLSGRKGVDISCLDNFVDVCGATPKYQHNIQSITLHASYMLIAGGAEAAVLSLYSFVKDKCDGYY